MRDFSKYTKHSTRQEGRFLPTLDFDYVRIDERNFEDLLRFVYGLSKLICYYNEHNEPAGDWSDFLNDELIVLTAIQQAEPGQAEIRFRQAAEKALLFRHPEKKGAFFEKCLREIYQIAQDINAWLYRLKQIEQFASVQLDLRDEILNLIDTRLGLAFRQLLGIHRAAQEILYPYTDLDLSEFHPLWRVSEAHSGYDLEGDSPAEKVRYALYDLEAIFQSFYESLVFLKNQAPHYLQQSLQSNRHAPQVTLLIAFLRLFQHSQTNLNQLSRRYLEFYYETVLKESPRNPVHDTVYLSFLVNDNAPHALVNSDEFFIGGEYANGENILYRSQEAILVNKAQIQKLFTIFTERNELNIYGRRKYLISNVLASEIPIEQVRPQPSLNEKTAFPIFGESQREKSVYERTMLDARLGFAVASPSFFLQEGRRQVSVTFAFDPSSLANMRQVLRDLSLASGDSGEEVFIKSFLEAFQLEITSPEGWYPIRKYVVNRVKTKVEEEDFSALSIRFDLERNEPPFVAYQAAIHGGQYQTSHPLLKILLNSQSYIYPYSLLNELILTQIDISTQVKELKNLQLYSEIGPLDAANPFFPFGAVPNVGSYLIVGSAEIFQKSLNHLALHIEWFNLPRDPAGFGGYYQDYEAGLDNAAFEVKLSILEDGRWKPEMPEEQQDFKLFRTKRTTPSAENASTTPQAFGMLSPYTHLEAIDMVRIKLPHNFEEMYKPNAYSNTARRGFLKIELSQPELAFGHSLYPTVLSEIVTENAKSSLVEALRRGFAKKQPKKLPNTPYNPQIKSLSLDYASSSVITLNDRATHATQTDRGRFYHILPFGEHQVYPDQGAQHIFLLPEIRYQGALLIGLSHLHPPQSISILFEMAQTGSDSSEEVPPVLEWSYLSEDQWRVLPESKILRDETSQFIRTGIVVIDLPREMQKGNQILDASLHWLRIAAIENVQNASPLRSLCTQVIKASLVNLDEEGKHLQKPLPAFTITRSINNLIGIQRIMQPLPSFGGQAHESQKSFYTRLSERLRHKQRAITAWDYERLILEHFPEVQKATCLSNMSSQASQQANSVLIVVSPYPKALNEREGLASREKLYEIKEYLKPFLSPFVKLEVRNPAYERIKIICAVKMVEGYQYGLYLQKLNDALNDYLKRDLLQGGKNIELGGRINLSDILSFMRTLPYVEFITKFSMIQIANEAEGRFTLLDTAREGGTKSFLQATKPWSALVPAEEHQITLIDAREEIKSAQAGIADLELGREFIVEE